MLIELPAELVVYIISFLNDRSVRRLANVCRDCQEYALSDIVWVERWRERRLGPPRCDLSYHVQSALADHTSAIYYLDWARLLGWRQTTGRVPYFGSLSLGVRRVAIIQRALPTYLLLNILKECYIIVGQTIQRVPNVIRMDETLARVILRVSDPLTLLLLPIDDRISIVLYRNDPDHSFSTPLPIDLYPNSLIDDRVVEHRSLAQAVLVRTRSGTVYQLSKGPPTVATRPSMMAARPPTVATRLLSNVSFLAPTEQGVFYGEAAEKTTTT
jgi:hypothetical protein